MAETTGPPLPPGTGNDRPGVPPGSEATRTAREAPPEDPAPLGPGRRFGAYVLRERLGQGGMGIVFRAEQPELQRSVALKLLPRGDVPDEELLARFRREAQAAARLRHPGIVQIHEVGEAEGRHYFTMDWIEGEDLARIAARGPLPPRRAAELVRDAARAIHYAHTEGVLHRDLKPANLLAGRDGRTYVTDFGLARDLKSVGDRLSVTGCAMGTPAYMAPEQARGALAAIGPATDIYGLGAVLYHLLTGRAPFDGDNAVETLLRVVERDPPAPRALVPRIPVDLETICLRALAKDPGCRYPTAAELAAECERFLGGEPVLARRPGWARRAAAWCARRRAPLATGIAALAAIVLAAGLFGRGLFQRGERLARVERMHALQAAMHEARPSFYVPGPDVYDRLRRVRAALADLQSLALDPDAAQDLEVWRSLGMGWYFVGVPTRAEQALAHATTIAPDDPGINYYLGRIFLERSGMARLLCPNAPVEFARTQARRWNDAAIACLRRAGAGGGCAEELDRHVADAYRAAVERHWDEVERLCREGLDRSGNALGTEEYWVLLGRAREKPTGSQAAIEAYGRALERRPHFAQAFFDRALLRHSAGDTKGALTDIEDALLLNPDFALSHEWRGLLRWALGDVSGAVADISEAVRIDPDYANGHHNLGILRYQAGEYDRALAHLDAALRADPGYAEAFVSRGLVHLAQGDRTRARADLDAAVRLAPGLAVAWLDRAKVRGDQGDRAGAIADCDEALRLDPDQAAAWFNRGVFFLMSDPARAARDLGEAIRRAPNDVQAHLRRAQARDAAGDRAGAIAGFGDVLQLDAGNFDAWYGRARTRYDTGDLEAALVDIDKALERSPASADAHNVRALIRWRRGDRAGALAELGEAIRLKPQQARYRGNRGGRRLDAGDVAGAIADLDEAVRLEPDAPAWTYNRALARERMNDLQGAEADLTRTLELRPGDQEARLKRAAMREALGKVEGAVADASEAIRVAPRRAEAWAIRANARGKGGDTAGQLADYLKALEVAPADWPHRANVEAAVERLRKAGQGK